MTPLAARVLLTYLLHSTLLLGAAALARLWLRERRLALQEALLRAALLGGVMTTALQVGLELRPLSGVLHVPQAVVAGAVAIRPSNAEPAPAPAPAAASGLAEGALPAGEPAFDATKWQARVMLAPTVFDRAAAWALASWRGVLGAAWAALAALGLLRLAVAGLRLKKLLRDREPIADGPLTVEAASVASALGLRGPVPLSAAPRLSVPLATGVLRPQACLPTRAVVELGRDELVALCAHELAHVRRRDPAWVLLARLVETAAPLQPLNAWARRRLSELAECLSDDLAVSASARPLGLARSLVDVASWTVGHRPVLPAAAAGALSARSRLGHRVERLMDPARALERPRRLLLPLAALAAAGTAFLAPAVSGSEEPQTAAPAVASQAPTAPAPATPEAAPAPRQAPKPVPKPRPAPEAAAPSTPADREAARADLERQIEALGRRIEERARLHEAEMQKLDAEMNALAARLQPNEAEMERLGHEMEKAAADMTTAIAGELGGEEQARSGEQARAAAKRMAELRDEMQAASRGLRGEEMRSLGEQARALAERARPTAEEMRELQRLSREMGRVSGPDAEEIRAEVRRAMDEAHQAMEQAREAMREASEAMRHAAQPEQPNK